MEKYKKYISTLILLIAIIISIFGTYKVIYPRVIELQTLDQNVIDKQKELEKLNNDLKIVQKRIEQIQNSIMSAQKKVYYPAEADLGHETIFFTLYSDLVDMLRANSVKIKSVNYVYNPEEDPFVKFGKEVYFVCDINLELVSNYMNLERLVQGIYQYPYYTKINSIEIKPFLKDKKILITKLSLRLYAHTSPDNSNQ